MNRTFIRIVFLLSMICVTCISCHRYTSNDTSNDTSNGTSNGTSNDTSNGTSTSTGNEYASYREAIAAEDFEAAHSILDKAKADRETLDLENIEHDAIEYCKKYGISLFDDLKSAEEEVLQSEFNYLATQGTDEANKRLLVLLNTQPMEGTPRSEGQELSKGEREDYATISSVSVYDQGYRDYINWCGKYNARCLQVLDIAITLDNKELAKMMVKAIKNDPEIISKRARSSDKDHIYYDIYAHYTSRSKNEAISKYKERFGELGNTDK